jgi:F0F1-type ATP synthase gamma subunit
VHFNSLKKAISLALVIAITSNTALAGSYSANKTSTVQAHHSEDIQRVFDEYQYYMDGWDGSDKEYKADADIR